MANDKKFANRDNNALAVEVIRFDIETAEGLNALEKHVLKTWTIGEILDFQSFIDYTLSGGTFLSRAGWTREKMSGIGCPTEKSDRELRRLWTGLVAFSNQLIGAAAILKVKEARIFKLEQLGSYYRAQLADKSRTHFFKSQRALVFGKDDELQFWKVEELERRIDNQYKALCGNARKNTKALTQASAKML